MDGHRIERLDGGLQKGHTLNSSTHCNVNAGCPNMGNFIYNGTAFGPKDFIPEIFFKAGSGETLFQNNLVFVEEGSSVLQT